MGGTSSNAHVEELAGGTSFEEGTELMLFTDKEGTELEMLPANVGCMRFFGLRFATSVLMCSPPRAACVLAALPTSCDFARGDGGGVMWLLFLVGRGSGSMDPWCE